MRIGQFYLCLFEIRSKSLRNWHCSLPPRRLLLLQDIAIRGARGLGLDRLGHAREDIAYFNRSESMQYPLHQRGFKPWAAATLARKDFIARETGRAIWCALLEADWCMSILDGCYVIHPNTFVTKPPLDVQDQDLLHYFTLQPEGRDPSVSYNPSIYNLIQIITQM